MNTNIQLKIDRNVIKPITYCMNYFVRIAGKILNIDHSLAKPFKTIAVCKFKGMGSIIQATALLQTLKNKYPESHLIFVSTLSNKELLTKISSIDEIITLDDKSFLKLIRQFPAFIITLIKRKINAYYDLEIYSNFSTLVTALSLAQNRFGYYLRSSDFRMGIYTHMLFYNIKSPIYQTYLQPARLSVEENMIMTDIQTFKGNKNRTSDIINKIKDLEYIVINPNASDLRIERRWNIDKFIELIKNLLVKYPLYRIILIGNNQEKEYVGKIISAIDNDSVISFAGKTSIDELITIIENAKLLITNDTGPMHIAFATKTKIVALFGPCSPTQYSLNNRCTVVYHNVYCSPCVHEFAVSPCNGNNKCMELITVNEVLEAIRACISGVEYAISSDIIYSVDTGKNYFALGSVLRSI